MSTVTTVMTDSYAILGVFTKFDDAVASIGITFSTCYKLKHSVIKDETINGFRHQICKVEFQLTVLGENLYHVYHIMERALEEVPVHL